MPLSLQAHKIPSSMSDKKTLNPTMDLVQRVLTMLGFQGSWRLQEINRVSKKADERFRAIRLQNDGVLLRIKPGGNDTCYLWSLVPGADAKIGKIPIGIPNLDIAMDRLQQVHPKKLDIPSSSIIGPFTGQTLAGERALLGGLGRPTPPGNLFSTALAEAKKDQPKPAKDQPKPEPAPVMQRTVPIPESAPPKVGCGHQDDNGRACGKPIAEILELPNGQKAATCAEHQTSQMWKEINTAANIEKKRLADTAIAEQQRLAAEAEAQRLAAEKAEQDRLAALVPKPEAPKPAQRNDLIYSNLKLNRSHGGRLIDNQDALDRALIAATFVMKPDGSALRSHVTGTIVIELGLEEFIETSSTYTKIGPTVRSLIMGLCNESYIQRFQFRQKKRTRQKPSTEGYMITPHGRERISMLMDLMSDELAARLWGGPPANEAAMLDIEDFEEDFEDVVEEAAVVPAAKSADPRPPIPQHPAPAAHPVDTQFSTLEQAGVFGKIKPLMDQHDKLAEEIKQLAEFIGELRISDIQPHEIFLAGLESTIGKYEQELAKVQANLDNLRGERQKRQAIIAETEARIKEFEEERVEKQASLEAVQKEIRQRMAAFS